MVQGYSHHTMYIQIHTNTIACINKIHWKKDGINRLQFLASVEEKNVEPLNDHKKKLSGMWRVVYFDVLEIQSSHMWMNIVFLQMLCENILFEKLCGNSDGWIFFAAQTCFQWWENNIGYVKPNLGSIHKINANLSLLHSMLVFFTVWNGHWNVWNSQLANWAFGHAPDCDVECAFQLQYPRLLFCRRHDLQSRTVHFQLLLVQSNVLLRKGTL